MAEFAELQSAFAIGLGLPARADGAAALPGDPLLERFSGDMRLNARRFAVYANNVRAIRMRALDVAYPVIRKIVGDEFFEGLTREYARRFDSVDGDLNLYGNRFAQFVAAFEHTQDLPYLHDVARLEWLAHRAYFAEDATGFDAVQLGSIPAECHAELVFAAHGACALITSDYPLAAIWEAHRPSHAEPLPVAFTPGPHYALVFRPELEVQVCALDADEYVFLDALLSGFNLGSALELALEQRAAFDLGAALGNAIERKTLASYRLETP